MMGQRHVWPTAARGTSGTQTILRKRPANRAQRRVALLQLLMVFRIVPAAHTLPAPSSAPRAVLLGPSPAGRPEISRVNSLNFWPCPEAKVGLEPEHLHAESGHARLLRSGYASSRTPAQVTPPPRGHCGSRREDRQVDRPAPVNPPESRVWDAAVEIPSTPSVETQPSSLGNQPGNIHFLETQSSPDQPGTATPTTLQKEPFEGPETLDSSAEFEIEDDTTSLDAIKSHNRAGENYLLQAPNVSLKRYRAYVENLRLDGEFHCVRCQQAILSSTTEGEVPRPAFAGDARTHLKESWRCYGLQLYPGFYYISSDKKHVACAFCQHTHPRGTTQNPQRADEPSSNCKEWLLHHTNIISGRCRMASAITALLLSLDGHDEYESIFPKTSGVWDYLSRARNTDPWLNERAEWDFERALQDAPLCLLPLLEYRTEPADADAAPYFHLPATKGRLLIRRANEVTVRIHAALKDIGYDDIKDQYVVVDEYTGAGTITDYAPSAPRMRVWEARSPPLRPRQAADDVVSISDEGDSHDQTSIMIVEPAPASFCEEEESPEEQPAAITADPRRKCQRNQMGLKMPCLSRQTNRLRSLCQVTRRRTVSTPTQPKVPATPSTFTRGADYQQLKPTTKR
ncbi:Gastric mucin [Giardia duodenalis assemblage B]|uniref:Gastric mucin n=1 Tax=Giardia duodenalis assemblage B TaxID=1394984 RepID=A0A132NMU9_GIAIN|nr:Gastric mucin [Giardia intestinalis assemblage B]